MSSAQRFRLTVAVFLIVAVGLLVWWGPTAKTPPPPSQETPTASAAAPDRENQPRTETPEEQPDAESRHADRRRRMVEQHLRGRDITDSRVLDVMGRVPRHRFVPERLKTSAYSDRPLPIGHHQTISQPYIVALMTQLVQPKPQTRALDIGTGSGYQAAVLAELCSQVYSIEIVPPLADSARDRLAELGYKNVEVRAGDGYRGWPEHAPFDVIIVAAAPDHVPQALVEQLAPGGRLVIPVGRHRQNLRLIEKRPDGSIVERNVIPVAFVPMTGEAQQDKQSK